MVVGVDVFDPVLDFTDCTYIHYLCTVIFVNISPSWDPTDTYHSSVEG